MTRNVRGVATFGLMLALGAGVAGTLDAGSVAAAEAEACPAPVLGAAGPAAAANAVPAASTAPAGSAGPNTSPAPALAASRAPDASRPDFSRGRWLPMARAPFGSEYEPVAWTGSRMVAVDLDSGRTAVYRPDRNRWREVARSPRRFGSAARSTWTGNELVIVEMASDGSSIRGAAYEPSRDRWRRIAALETEPDGEADHALTDAVWEGSHVIVVDGLGSLAAYDPAADCWAPLGEVPGEPWATRLYVAGPTLLVESRRRDDPIELRAFDPAASTWSEPTAGPLSSERSESGGAWSDGRLIYLDWYPTEDAEPVAASFDPGTMTWSALDADCQANASGSLAVDGLVVASNLRRAFDDRSLDCIGVPAPPRRLNGTERLLWTGRELIAWSGIRSLPAGPLRTGLRFRPAQ